MYIVHTYIDIDIIIDNCHYHTRHTFQSIKKTLPMVFM